MDEGIERITSGGGKPFRRRVTKSILPLIEQGVPQLTEADIVARMAREQADQEILIEGGDPSRYLGS